MELDGGDAGAGVDELVDVSEDPVLRLLELLLLGPSRAPTPPHSPGRAAAAAHESQAAAVRAPECIHDEGLERVPAGRGTLLDDENPNLVKREREKTKYKYSILM